MTRGYRFAVPILATIPTAAWAHPGHGITGGFGSGILHPLTGMDHIVAMVLIGVWAGLMVPQTRGGLLIPLAFLMATMAGLFAGPLVGGGIAEPLIPLSLAFLGIAAALRAQPPVELAVAGAALFGFAHGAAHGFEAMQGAAPALFAVGLLLCTAALHGVGLFTVKFLPETVVRVFSALAATTALAISAAV